MCSPVQLDSCTYRILPGRSCPWCESHWHSTPPSTWCWLHTAEAVWWFHPYLSTSLLLAAVPAWCTKHPHIDHTRRHATKLCFTGFILSSWTYQILAPGKSLITESQCTSDRMKCPTLAHCVSSWFLNCEVSATSSWNSSRAGFTCSAFSLWPAHHPHNIKYFFFFLHMHKGINRQTSEHIM